MNSDGHLFDQYQQSEQSLLTKHKKGTHDVGNPGPGWDRHVNVERINQSNESHPFPFNNWMSNDYAYIYIYLYVNVSEILQEREGHDIENILQLFKDAKITLEQENTENSET